jgi:hypothetical protein
MAEEGTRYNEQPEAGLRHNGTIERPASQRLKHSGLKDSGHH